MTLTQVTTGGVDENINIDSNTLKVDATNNRVGIGTAAPGKDLEIYNNTGPTISLNDGDDYKSYFTLLGNDLEIRGSSGNIEFYTGAANGASSTERARFDSSGRLLLNTTTEGDSSADDLTVNNSTNCGITIRSGSTYYGSLYFSDATSGTGEYEGYVQYNHNSRFLTFGVASQTRMQIDSSGDVGIGTTSPSSKLHVNGTITDSIGPIRRLGITTHNASTLTLAATHAGNLIREATNSANITLPSGVFSAGDMITIFNVSSGDNTITQGSGVTLYNTADAATGNRTLAAKGVCTIACTSTNEFIISGSGLS